MKERPILFSTPMVKAIQEGRKTQTRRVIQLPWKVKASRQTLFQEAEFYRQLGIQRYGKKGDRLWVRETWTSGYYDNDASVLTWYKAGPCSAEVYRKAKWKPSIFMPRVVCRYLLEVKDIWAEKIQDITEADAKAEGVNPFPLPKAFAKAIITGTEVPQKHKSYRFGFQMLWDYINEKRGYAWETNCWVNAIHFRILDQKLTKE